MAITVQLELSAPPAPYRIKVEAIRDLRKRFGTVYHPSVFQTKRVDPNDPTRLSGQWVNAEVKPGQVLTFNGHPGEADEVRWCRIVEDDRSPELKAAHKAQWRAYKTARARWLADQVGPPPAFPDVAAALVTSRQRQSAADAGATVPGNEFADGLEGEDLEQGDGLGDESSAGEGQPNAATKKATPKKATAKGGSAS